MMPSMLSCFSQYLLSTYDSEQVRFNCQNPKAYKRYVLSLARTLLAPFTTSFCD